MATYQQLYDAVTQGGPVLNRAVVAVAVAAQKVLVEQDTVPNHAARLTWARNALSDPGGMVKKMSYAIAADPVVSAKALTTTDAELQTAVDSLVDAFALI